MKTLKTLFKVKFRNPVSGEEHVYMRETFPTLEWLQARIDSLEDATPIGQLPPQKMAWQVISIETWIDYESKYRE